MKPKILKKACCERVIKRKVFLLICFCFVFSVDRGLAIPLFTSGQPELLQIPAEDSSKPDPPAPKPQMVDDFSETQGLVLMVGSGAGTAQKELDRVAEVFNTTLNTGVTITILTNEHEKNKVIETYKDRNRVRVVELPFDADIYGSGFPRDNMPFPITTTDENGKTKYKYLFDVPTQGEKMLDALVKEGQIAKKDTIKTPFHFEGGDMTTLNGVLFVTDGFYKRNKEIKGLTEKQVNQHLKDYLGVSEDDIVKLTQPPSEQTGHSDLLVRPLPNGKIVVSVPGSDEMKQEDKKALNANLAVVIAKFGEEKVVKIPTAGKDPVATYANTVISKKVVLIPILDDEDANKVAVELYKKALPADYKVLSLEAFDQCTKAGGPHCRIGNITLKSLRKNAAGVSKSPTIFYDADTGLLSMTTNEIDLLTGPNTWMQDTMDPSWIGDPLVTSETYLELTGLKYQPLRNDSNVATFEGGKVKLINSGKYLFEGDLPSLLFWKSIDQGYLDIFGILEDITINNFIGSTFLADKVVSLEESQFFMDFYMISSVNLFDISNDFTTSFTTNLSGAGISLNGTVSTQIPEPGTVLLLFGGLVGVISLTRLKSIK